VIGKTLSHYRIVEKIGAGGMGEVYRASDGKLGRDVAIKVLPEALARDPERMARFQREAQLLAQLNHPNVAAIYGLETDAGVTALVLELVEGPTLAERIRTGPVPPDEAISVARQVAEAIETAHERGIVHRDLKPANVKLTPDGVAKVLDFGLARALGAEPSSASGDSLDSPTLSPTLTSPVITGALTGANVILGTAAYMSPEQARGKHVDKRSDIWSFGVVCWEMLTGRRLFEGETVSDTLAAVLKTDPDWDTLPAGTPEPLVRLLKRCLERDPRKRLRDIGEARIRLELWQTDPSSLAEAAGGADAPAPRASRWPWIVTAAAVLAAGGIALFARPEPEPPRALTLDILLPHQEDLAAHSGLNIQFSPDGKRLAYRTKQGIRVRPLDEREGRLLPGTDQARQFAFSPDGQWIAFVTDAQMLRVNVAGGAPILICDGALVGRGITWLRPDTIVFTPTFTGGLKTVDVATGELRDLTVTDAEAGERSHRWPSALPDGNSVVFVCQFVSEQYDEGEIRIIGLNEDVATPIYRGGSAPRYSPSGHLLFVKGQTLFAVPLDLKSRVTAGLPVPVLDQVWSSGGDQETDDGSAQYDLSSRGDLIYRTQPGGQRSNLLEVDLEAGVTRRLGSPGSIRDAKVSPDGTRLAVLRAEGGPAEIHLLDLRDGGTTRFTFDGGTVSLGCWSRDSRTLYWARTERGVNQVLSRRVDGSGTPVEILRNTASTPGEVLPHSEHPDGRRLLGTSWLAGKGGQLWGVVEVSLTEPDTEPTVLAGARAMQTHADFSPDGRWFAYLSNEDQTWAIYLRRYPDTGAKWTVTGGEVFYMYDWLGDGSGILVHDERGVYRIPVRLDGESPHIGRAEPLLADGLAPSLEVQNMGSFTADGKKLYTVVPDRREDEPDRVVLMTGWVEQLAGRRGD